MRILVVDDDAGIRSLVADYLQAQGDEVVTAGDGAQTRAVLGARAST